MIRFFNGFGKRNKRLDLFLESFDIDSFVKSNEDLEELCSDIDSLKKYFLNGGLKEIQNGKRRFSSKFSPYNEERYLTSFPDVEMAVKRGVFESGFEHFLKFGYREILNGERVWSRNIDRDFYREIAEKLSQFTKEEFFDNLRERDRTISVLNKREIIERIMTGGWVRPGNDPKNDALFYVNLSKLLFAGGEQEKGDDALLYSLSLYPTGYACEIIGNRSLDRGEFLQAILLYRRALEYHEKNGSLPESEWIYLNSSKAYQSIGRHREAGEILVKGLKNFPLSETLIEKLDQLVENLWRVQEQKSHYFSKIDDRQSLMEVMTESVREISHLYRSVFQTTFFEPPVSLGLNDRRVLIIGDYHIPQCIRYRIDQKREQLEMAGYTVTEVSWTKLTEEYQKIFFHDLILYYRVPALPVVVKSMEQARSLGKVLIYEIDDLIFDPLYPPEYESYGGNISAGEYEGLLTGMPLFREAAKLCDYAVASTLPLLKRLEPLVQTGRGFLHRNGLDSHNMLGEPIGKDYINIFYGSGTLAHNSDFIELVLPALERLLREKKDLRLTIVGHLTLPEEFIRKFPEQVVQVEKTRTVEEYWQYLRRADINLAVLHSDPINDTKSELKWFEAACFKVPSIVSNTQNYLDVIREGEDALIAGDEEEWYASLRRLVDDASLRREIGERAYHRVIREYSLEALSENIDKILKSILSDREKRFEDAS